MTASHQTSAQRAAIGGVVALLLGVSVLLAPTSDAAAQDKVTICHRTNSVTSPYTVNSVAVSSIDGSKKNDHSHHLGPVFDYSDPGQYVPPFGGDEWGDIIPPHPVNENLGQNWTEIAYDGGPTGQEIHEAGCRVPGEDPEDPTAALTIRKVVTGADAPETWDFKFSLTAGDMDLGPVMLDEVGAESSFLELAPGDYTIIETLVEEFTLEDVDCGEATVAVVDNGVTVTLAEDDDMTCWFTNDHATPVAPTQPAPENVPEPEVLDTTVTRKPAQPAPAVQSEVRFTG